VLKNGTGRGGEVPGGAIFREQEWTRKKKNRNTKNSGMKSSLFRGRKKQRAKGEEIHQEKKKKTVMGQRKNTTLEKTLPAGSLKKP